jgi:glutaminyl-peptide cyclotransferase
MKKFIVIGLIALVGIAVFVTPLLKGGSTEDGLPAEFTFKENLATEWDKAVDLTIKVNSDDIAKLELIYNDSVFQTWKNPKGQIKYRLNASFYGLGTKNLSLVSTMTDGTEDADERLVRIVSDKKPEIWTLSINKSYPHNTTHFTQGLEFDGNVLYQGTGDPRHEGLTLVGTVDLNTGEYTKKIGLDATHFGEGISILNNKIYQLTYTTGKCFIYDKATLTLIDERNYSGEGWGLCNDGEILYMTDGSERITKRDPKNFDIIETIEVADDNGPIRNLNELEYVDGLIYANVWQTNSILVIQPENGKVVAVINAMELTNQGQNGGDVLNGIAFNKTNGKFYMTGKYWSKMFEVTVNKQAI